MRFSTPTSLLLVVFLVLGSSSAAEATIVERLSVQQMTQAASVIAVGTIQSSESRWTADGYRIVTEYTLRVEAHIKGEPDAQDIAFQVMGGTVGDLAQFVAGEATFEEGERVLVFLEPRPDGSLGVVGMSQGKYSISTDVLTGVPQATPATAHLKLADIEHVDPGDGSSVQRIVGLDEPPAHPAPVSLDALVTDITGYLSAP